MVCEPYEEVTIDVAKEYYGLVSEELGKRKAELINMNTEGSTARLIFKISSQNLLGIRSSLLTKTRGTVTLSTFFLGYFPKGNKMEVTRNGAIVSLQPGEAFTYGLVNAQNRGRLFISPGTQVYEGMVVGVGTREFDIEINVCKEKKLTNNRSVGEGVSTPLIPAAPLSLEEALDFIAEDEMLEVTPLNLRIRKMYLSQTQRRVMDNKG